jgi:23S rRNA (cytosine1962-C5)-methyltransferase
MRTYRDNNWKFDAVILDPPKFAHSKRHVEKATQGYKDINLLGMKLIKPGGVLITFSCSGAVSPDLFQKVLFGAAVDAGRHVQIIEHLSQSADHPILLTYPESEYLKGLVCRVW